MDFISIEKKWNEIWEKSALHTFNNKNLDKKYYVLEMFSYPSGSNLHLGHWYNYGPTDSFARFKRMQGYEVFQPMGFDAFGLPAENYAIKTGIHPKDSTAKTPRLTQYRTDRYCLQRLETANGANCPFPQNRVRCKDKSPKTPR